MKSRSRACVCASKDPRPVSAQRSVPAALLLLIAHGPGQTSDWRNGPVQPNQRMSKHSSAGAECRCRGCIRVMGPRQLSCQLNTSLALRCTTISRHRVWLRYALVAAWASVVAEYTQPHPTCTPPCVPAPACGPMYTCNTSIYTYIYIYTCIDIDTDTDI